ALNGGGQSEGLSAKAPRSHGKQSRVSGHKTDAELGIRAIAGRAESAAMTRRSAAQAETGRRALAIETAGDLAQLGPVVGGLYSPDRSGARAHDERLGRRMAVVEIPHPVEQVTVGDAGGGEEDVLPAHQVVRVQHPGKAVAGVLRRLALLVASRPQPAEDAPADALDRGR